MNFLDKRNTHVKFPQGFKLSQQIGCHGPDPSQHRKFIWNCFHSSSPKIYHTTLILIHAKQFFWTIPGDLGLKALVILSRLLSKNSRLLPPHVTWPIPVTRQGKIYRELTLQFKNPERTTVLYISILKQSWKSIRLILLLCHQSTLERSCTRSNLVSCNSVPFF